MALATTSFAGCLTRRGVLDCVCFLAQTIVWFLITFSQQICLPIEMPRLGCCSAETRAVDLAFLRV